MQLDNKHCKAGTQARQPLTAVYAQCLTMLIRAINSKNGMANALQDLQAGIRGEFCAMVKVFLTVFDDAVKMEIEQYARRESAIGWFRDEVSAIAAALERVMMRSAIQSELRKLPQVIVESTYRAESSGRKVVDFKRATRIKNGPLGRRFVMVPGAYGKAWLRDIQRDYTVGI